MPFWLIKKQRPGAGTGPYRKSRQNALKRLLGVLFRHFFRRRQAFEALEQLFFGHPVGRYLRVVRIDAGAGLWPTRETTIAHESARSGREAGAALGPATAQHRSPGL